MRDGLAKWAAIRRGVIDMDRVEISREAREQDDIRLRHGPSRTLPFIADDEIIKRPD